MTEDQVYLEIGSRMRTLRRWRKLNQQQVADRMRLTRTSIVNAEAGRQRMPLWNLLQLSEILDVPTHVWLLAPKDWRAWCKASNVTTRRKVLRTVEQVKTRRMWVEEVVSA